MISSFKPELLTIIMCNGKLKHCDLKKNYGDQGYSNKEICRSCILSRDNSIKEFKELAQNENIEINIKFINENSNSTKKRISNNCSGDFVFDRPYYLSELCSYYRLDELSMTRVIQNSSKMFVELNTQSKELIEYFENNIQIGDNISCLGVVFNGRLSPHSDFIRWAEIKCLNVVVHERGRVDGIYNIRLNRSALDQYEYNYFKRDYLKIWKPKLYPLIMDKIQREYLEKGNTTSRIWKESQIEKYQKGMIKDSDLEEILIIVFMSSTDEAFDDNGTLLLELQLKLIEILVNIKKELKIRIKIKPHPDTISRIDLTCQHLIVNKLLSLDNEVEILWPEAKNTVTEICKGADIVFVPHSSVAIELAYSGIGFVSFQDSPFADFADAKMNVGEITEMECLKILMIDYIENKQKVRERFSELESIDKHLLSWLMWDAIFSGKESYINQNVANALNRISRNTLREIGLLAKNDRLDLASFRHTLISQAKAIDTYLIAYEALRGSDSKIENDLVDRKNVREIYEEGNNIIVKRTEKVSIFKNYNDSDANTSEEVKVFGDLLFCIGEYTLIRSKIDLLPDKVHRFAKNGVVLINGILRIDDIVTRLIGWDVPKKATRSYELKEDYKLPNQSAMLLTASQYIMNILRVEYVGLNQYKESRSEVTKNKMLLSYMEANAIVYMKYREPLVMCSVKSGYSEATKKK
ncbi:hypothetical protein PMIT1313_00563 [Prochlorococcus marinus str. MIT 1313]|uniref:hypothetical protein n=1 Tax=Prochlorococcus TaxID=1218 RepID=UPI0007BC2B1B|nr:hypothetical protein [Prochlorococcus marinus]KZR70253.1 hypothetical protein PMIT1313_00563 [Prochlorococcus marinus str. MIT 1313]KZR70725.1 hypothetical protein PMIT1318_01865 [Prochlorococcus marinus str. MIT 1318]